MIAMETEELSKETERCIKKCIKLHQKEVAKYGHTELFLLEELDKYTNLSVRYLNWMIKHYNITDNTNHKILTQEEINNIYEKKGNKSCNPSVMEIHKGNNNRTKNTCLRCGKEFSRLNKHLNTKKECIPLYLNVDRNRIIPEYEKLYNEYEICIKKKSLQVKCDICGITISRKSNLARHKRIHEREEKELQTINGKK